MSPIEVFRKPVDRPKADHAAVRDIGLDVRITVGRELLERGIKRVHSHSTNGASSVRQGFGS